ncbi:MAG: glycosyltransferase, partial [Chloroflexi bacterium]|nr:glycosyltransferase [Chloroflexota bacterium]
ERVKQAGDLHNVSFLGERMDVAGILAACDIGVLSSRSEGLPLALIEYGRAGLPVVTTSVGQTAEVVDSGRAGLLVEPADPRVLAEALIHLLRSPRKRVLFGSRLRCRVEEIYSPENAMRQICEVYSSILRSRGDS